MFDHSKFLLLIQNEEKDVYRPSSLRERDKHRVPLSNVFETEEKRREIQKEIERAQRLLSEPIDQQEAGSQPDGEIDEGEELEKVWFVFAIYYNYILEYRSTLAIDFGFFFFRNYCHIDNQIS